MYIDKGILNMFKTSFTVSVGEGKSGKEGKEFIYLFIFIFAVAALKKFSVLFHSIILSGNG